MANNVNYLQVLDLAGVQQLWNACKATFIQTVNGNSPDANGNVVVSGVSALDSYPVGSIYLSVNNTSPASLFGGTWTQIKDVFLLGAGDIYSNGATGGEATHILTENEMPSHRHTLTVSGDNSEWLGRINATVEGGVWRGTSDVCASAGGGQAHNNMPPYLVVYIWKRTA